MLSHEDNVSSKCFRILFLLSQNGNHGGQKIPAGKGVEKEPLFAAVGDAK